MVEDIPVEVALQIAREELEDFEARVTGDRLLARLNADRPAHPLLLGYKFFLGLMAVCVVACLVFLAAPLMGSEVVRALATIEAPLPLPLPLVCLTLAFCFGALGVALRFGAIERGNTATMLPWEQKEHQRLMGELQRLQSRKSLEERTRQ